MLSAQHRAAPPLPAVRRLTAVLMLLGAVAHLGFLAEFLLDTALSPWRVLPAYLLAEHQPYRDVFRVADWVAGGAFVVVSPPLLRIAPVHWLSRLTVAVLFASGVFLLLRAAFPPECVPTPSGLCDSPVERTVQGSVLLPAVQYLVSPAIVAAWWHGRWRTAVWTLFVIQLATWAVVIVLGWFALGWFVGLAVRVQIVTGSALLAVGAAYVLGKGVTRPFGASRRDRARERVGPCPE
ncbi:hypothetical protein [Saccharomonospora sp.]|uniref:hypothetical protein n=1 Tax=Saccharomonospora sp. TaxID=33913 RepID=UPI002639874C|nr:hypothetical protein [Saccharomonospora sp.]